MQTVLAPSSYDHPELVIQGNPLIPFSAITLDFLQQLSVALMKNTQAKTHPELVALGFWLRKANLTSLEEHKPIGLTKALGTVVHFTPSNVDTMFVYSWVCALLMGNKNIVRVASKDTVAQKILFEILNELFARTEYDLLAQSNVFVQFPKESEYSAKYSLLADARVIWGGDETVTDVRRLPSHPRCRDVSFADRYSASLINADAIQTEHELSTLAKLLWRDTEPYGQQACSSPKLLFWQGKTEKLQQLFCLMEQFTLAVPAELNQMNDHLVLSQLVMSQHADNEVIHAGRVSAVKVVNVHENLFEWHTGSGMFFVYPLTDISQLSNFLPSKLQTLSYWNADKDSLLKLVSNPSIKGIDRIVPLGQALDFSLLWDGYDLLNQFSRQIVVI